VATDTLWVPFGHKATSPHSTGWAACAGRRCHAKAAVRPIVRCSCHHLPRDSRLARAYARVLLNSDTEGYGRLDALNPIGNQVFGLDLGEDAREKNYAATTAPVNFPHIWNTSWFDWVQYNASIQQPMVRNAGEALGVSAPLNLASPNKPLTCGLQVRTIASIETWIAGDQPDERQGFTGLKSPKWPEEVRLSFWPWDSCLVRL
jgi:hypothetical protein